MQKFKTIKTKVIKYIGQSMADFLIRRLETSSTDEEFDFWFSMAIKLDAYYRVFYEIYLD